MNDIPDITYTSNLTGKLEIKQGATYRFSSIHFLGRDLTEWTIRGQIRRTYSDEEILATISFTSDFGTITLDEVEYPDTTSWYPYLPATVTVDLPPTVKGSPVIGKNAWVYDIELANPDNDEEVYRLVAGICQVSPEVTK